MQIALIVLAAAASTSCGASSGGPATTTSSHEELLTPVNAVVRWFHPRRRLLALESAWRVASRGRLFTGFCHRALYLRPYGVCCSTCSACLPDPSATTVGSLGVATTHFELLEEVFWAACWTSTCQHHAEDVAPRRPSPASLLQDPHALDLSSVVLLALAVHAGAAPPLHLRSHPRRGAVESAPAPGRRPAFRKGNPRKIDQYQSLCLP